MLNSRPAMYLKDKISDLTMKARSFGVKHVEVPTFAMAGGGSIGRPLKIPVGVGINQTKLDNLRQIKANKAANLNARSVANKADDVAEDLARSASRNKSSQLNHTKSEAGNHQGAGRPGQTHKELENDLNRKKVAGVSKETSHQTPPPVEKGRHVEVDKGIESGEKLDIASPNYKPYTSDHKKVLQEFPDFDETKPFIKTVENPSGKPKYTVHAYDPGPPPMAFEKQTPGMNFGLKGQTVTKSVNGNDVTIKYNENGFPIFDEHALVLNDKGDTVYRNTSQEFLNMSHQEQIREICKEPGITKEMIEGYTLHHHENVGQIQFIPTKIHAEFYHTGGMSLWGIGHKR